MPYKYSCFISYPHVTTHFVEQIKNDLEKEISLLIDDLEVFIDREKLKVANILDKRLAEALCKSVCMILIFTDVYFSTGKPWCAIEYKSMLALEQKRLKLLKEDAKSSMIIPIIIRSPSKVPEDIKRDRT